MNLLTITVYARTRARIWSPVRCCGHLGFQGGQILGFVYRTLGRGLDTRDLMSRVNSEIVHAKLDGMGASYQPVPILAILRVLHGWGIWIRHYECV